MPLQLTIEHLLGLRANEHMPSPVKEYFTSRRKLTNDYLHTLSAIRLLRELVEEFSYGSTPTLTDFVRFMSRHLSVTQVLSSC